jgi:hypothetical protein
MNNLQEILFFPVKDGDSRTKLLVAAALSLASMFIPILPWIFVLGYAGEIMRQVIIRKETPHMPEWNWGENFSLGGKLFGVHFIYSLPAALPMIVGYMMMIVPAILLDPEISGGNPVIAPEWLILGTFGGMALFSLGMLLSLLLWVALPPALSHAAAQDSFAAGFQIRAWWKVYRANLGGFILALVISGGLYMVMIFAIQILYLTLILCILAPFLMMFALTYLTLVAFALFAQAYKDGQEKLAAQPVVPLA